MLHTAKDVPGDDLGSDADIGLLELERDLRLDLVLLDVARREDRARECDVHVDAVHEELALEGLGEAWWERCQQSDPRRRGADSEEHVPRVANLPGEYVE